MNVVNKIVFTRYLMRCFHLSMLEAFHLVTKFVVFFQNIFIGLLGLVLKEEKATIESNRIALTPTAANFYLNKPM